MKPTENHPYVGRMFVAANAPDRVGRCVSVTPWGNDRIRWLRLRFHDGTQKSFAPSHLREVFL